MSKHEQASHRAATQEAAEALVEARRLKTARLRDKGLNPFANDVLARDGHAALSSFGEVREHHAGDRDGEGRYLREAVAKHSKRVRVAGRVIFLRSFGGGAFVRLRSWSKLPDDAQTTDPTLPSRWASEELQLYCQSKSSGDPLDGGTVLGDLGVLDEVDLGDFVEAEGTTMATQKGELSVTPDALRVITKAHRPLPTKTSFKDVESRYRQRYVDLVANKDVASVFRARTAIVSAVREYLDRRGFLEVETPTMSRIVGGALAKPFSTHHNALDLDLFLRIAPELYLKRLVVGGFERVYELARCYRNEGLSTRHNPEFTMLEYYQAYATYETLMDQTEELLRYVDRRLEERVPDGYQAFKAQRSFSLERFERLTMRALVERALDAAGLPPEAAFGVGEADAPIKEWAKLAKARGREIDWANFKKGAQKCDSRGELAFAAYEYLAEPFLTRDYRSACCTKSVPVFVIDHPLETSPLARKKDSDPSLTDRFELFVDGREICNAFSELNDPDDQAARFRAQVEKKARGAEETMDYDEDYVRALEHGMPPTAGFGMGIDRLTMILTGSASIRDVILFPLLRPEGAASPGDSEDHRG
mgnify:CR=1 FL=1